MTRSDERSAAASHHPALDQVAAFVDGRLTGEARRRMVEHVASCDDCQELVTETTLLLRDAAGEEATSAGGADDDDEERAEAPAGPGRLLVPPPGRFRRALPLLAALAAAAGIALFVWTPAGDWILGHRGREAAVADLTASLPTGDAALQRSLATGFDRHDWSTVRGTSAPLTPRQESTFRLGVRVAELDVALRTGDAETARLLTYRIETLLDESLDLPSLSGYFAGPGSIRDGLAGGAASSTLLALDAEADELLIPGPGRDDPGPVDGTIYALGKWAAAGQLAAAAGDLDWFSAAGPRRQLRRLAKADLPADLARPVAVVAETLDDGPTTADLPRLRDALTQLVDRGGG